MNALELDFKMITPAFLGGADQSSEWRAPAFKALLRQWWRVAVAGQLRYDHVALRETEGVLFGHAWLAHRGKSWAMRSPVQIRLVGHTRPGLGSWREDTRIEHPEVKQKVGAHLYLGYGPLTYEKGQGTKLKVPPAIAAGSEATLRVRFPGSLRLDEFSRLDDLRGDLDRTLRLIHLFGTVGGRSRNGWGSVATTRPAELAPECRSSSVPDEVRRPLEDCLKLDFAHAVGVDATGLLVWRTRRCFDGAADTLDELARLKIAFRTALDTGAQGALGRRHLLAYPVTHHDVHEWGQQARLANQLRFKVHCVTSGSRPSYFGVAFHVPHRLPEAMAKKLQDRGRWARATELEIWRKVHHVLDREMDRVG